MEGGILFPVTPIPQRYMIVTYCMVLHLVFHFPLPGINKLVGVAISVFIFTYEVRHKVIRCCGDFIQQLTFGELGCQVTP